MRWLFSQSRTSYEPIAPHAMIYLEETTADGMVVTADGQVRSWGGYGKLVNCVRPDDATEAWRHFLNADHLARSLWCAGRRRLQAATIAPEEFLDEVSAQIDEPCE